LQGLRGRKGAKIYDEIRRSESQVSMLLNAVMNPIKAGVWEFEAAGAEVADAEKHKELIEFIAKEMIDWETHLHEALTMLIFGYSLFEIINTVIFNHPKFGTFNGLKGLAFRSQKTIERWIVDRDTGNLKEVEQWVLGDLTPKGGTLIQMDANFLLVFTLQKEGDNYEGISALRPMYGPWFRKNLYLKIASIGLEKNAIGTPMGTVPTGKQKTDEMEAFKELLSNFTSHESAYLIKPEGWEVEIIKNDFDASKVKEMIVLENTEMINSLVANFLALGTSGGGGSFALGTDLSDFFLTGIQNYANIIAGVWNRKLIPELIKLNFGPQSAYPKLKATGINDKAGKELAEIIKSLTDAQVVKADAKLEEFVRKQYSLPKADELTVRAPTPAAPMQFSEKRILLAENYKKQWGIDKANVKSIMQSGLKTILDNYEKQIRSGWKASSASGRRNLALQLEPKGLQDYQNNLREALAKIANDAMNGAKKETPKANKLKIKLSEAIKLDAPKGGYFDALPSGIKNIIKNQAGLIVQTQSQDINKIVSFQFLSSADSTEDVNQVLNDIEGAVLPTLEDGATGAGMSIDAAAGNAVSSTINQARLEWFFEPEVLNTIESFTFTNEDPVSEICNELDGTTWAVGDPDLDRYTPPLHHNCKSRLEPNEKGADGNPDIDRGGTAVSQKELDSMTLHECCPHYSLKLGGPGSGPQEGGGPKTQAASAKTKGKSGKTKAAEPTADEAKAIRFYTGSQSSDFIAHDRGAGVSPENKEMNDKLNSYLDKSPKFEGDIHRGISVEKGDAQSVLDKYKPGASVELDAKQSWTTDPKNVKDRLTSIANGQKNPVPIVFQYPKSKVGVDISKQSRFEEEKEVLVPKGTKYKVKSVDKHEGGYKITFEHD
jgi:ADP-ribosyltransferase exoenzyme